jgi:hypothetical protein
MQRELRRDLFSSEEARAADGDAHLLDMTRGLGATSGPANRASVAKGGTAPTNQEKNANAYLPDIIKKLESEIRSLRLAQSSNEKKYEHLQLQFNELIKGTQTRIDRMQTAAQETEERAKRREQEQLEKWSMVSSKLSDRKSFELKVQEMIDRHNSLVRNFENKLASAQRLVAHQELTQHNSNALIEDLRAELARHRR